MTAILASRPRCTMPRRPCKRGLAPPPAHRPNRWISSVRPAAPGSRRRPRWPARLLDFTKSPYIAAFFAATDDAAMEHPSAVWAVNATALKKHAAEILNTERITVWVCAVAKKCLQGASFSEPEIFDMLFRGVGPMPSIVAPVEPFRFNKRMMLQQGLFLCQFSVGHQLAFEETLISVLDWMGSKGTEDSEVLHKVVVEAQAHPHVLRELHRMNVNDASLFPDLDGLARSLSNISRIGATCVAPARRPEWEFGMRF